MTVFISWSGPESKYVASVLYDKLPHIIQGLGVWTSDVNISAGTVWFSEIIGHVRSSTFGVLLVTPANVNSPWLNFEAGALTLNATTKRVVPVAVSMTKKELGSIFSAYHAVDLTRDGLLSLVRSLNECIEKPIPAVVLEAAFDLNWKQLGDSLEARPVGATPLEKESLEDMVTEIRDVARRNWGTADTETNGPTSNLGDEPKESLAVTPPLAQVDESSIDDIARELFELGGAIEDEPQSSTLSRMHLLKILSAHARRDPKAVDAALEKYRDGAQGD